MNSRQRDNAIRALALAPPLMLGACYLLFTVPFPYLDQWEFVPFLEKAWGGELGPRDFWAQHNEHRLIFPRLVMLTLARWTDWDIRFELGANFLLGLAVFGGYALLWRGSAYHLGADTPWRWPMLSLLAFSLSQWQNWFLGWQMQEFMNILAVLIMLWALSADPPGWPTVSAAALFGLVATYSFANGMLVWPIGAALLALRPGSGERGRAMLLPAWIGFSVLVAISYLWGFERPGYHPSIWSGLFQPVSYAAYILAYLGQPMWNFNAAGAMVLGGAGLGLGGLLAWRLWGSDRRMAALPWLGLAAYALGSAAITGSARLDLGGTEQAMSSRYVTMANGWWLALMGMAWLWAHQTIGYGRTRRRWVIRGYAAAMVLLLVASLHGTYRWNERYNAYRAVEPELLEGDDLDLLRRLHPKPEVILERRPVLRRLGLSIFGGPAEGPGE